ncbi:hypothetical protein PLICRDRAFT_57529 [Plicaturopsis crispa FD-325 SS-3]|uniref:Uncharacterized protein n=1 Tax=Plicaturopsis crispa FD-325 SS-3 TaxID=944288 RepID=A0A0C9T5B5_PLICR|nr:hypothetical protein PLICRDRAFT_57529 [Plicaturopsis crispa FD-325 SS-3]
MSSEQYLFHKTADGVYERKCYGLETLSGTMEQNCEGFTHLTVSAEVNFGTSPSRDVLYAQAAEAWTHLRHLVPGMASKVFRFPAPDNHYAFRYIVPKTPADVAAWVKETVFFEEADSKSFHEKHCALKDGRFWRPADDHYSTELHASPLGNGWQFSLIASHNNIDGRNGFAILDLFLEFLTAVIEKKAKAVADLKWGDEVKRLPPPGAFIKTLVETGKPPAYEKITPVVPPTPAPAPEGKKEEAPAAPAVVPWLYSPLKLDGKGDIARHIVFTPELTEKFHAVAKKNGRTVTQVVTALTMLAHAEASLKIAGEAGEERYNEVTKALAASSHYLVVWYLINHRHKFPGGYHSYKSEVGAPLCSADGSPLFIPIDSVKKLLKLDAAKHTATLEIDNDSFWKDAVKDAVAGINGADTSLEGYAAREVGGQDTLRVFDPAAMNLPTIVISSIGDLGRLNLLTPYLPSKERKTLTVTDVACGIRMRTWPIMNILYEYNGQLRNHFFTASEFTTPATLKLVTDRFEKLAAALVN